MTNLEFQNYLKKENICFALKENCVEICNNQGDVYLRSLTTLPEGVQFKNQGDVYLRSLTTLPEGVQFKNQGDVYLRSLTTLPEGVQFKNQGYVYLGVESGVFIYKNTALKELIILQ